MVQDVEKDLQQATHQNEIMASSDERFLLKSPASVANLKLMRMSADQEMKRLLVASNQVDPREEIKIKHHDVKVHNNMLADENMRLKTRIQAMLQD